MNSGRLGNQRVEELREPGEVHVGLLGDDPGQRSQAFVFRRQDHRSGPGGGELRTVFRIGKEGDLVAARSFERADLPDRRAGIPGNAAAEARGDVPERQRRRHGATWPGFCPAP